MSQAVATYQSSIRAALQEYSESENRFKILTDAVSEPVDQILTVVQSLIANLAKSTPTSVSKEKPVLTGAQEPDNPQELVAFSFKKIYGKFHALHKEQTFAITTLSHLQTILTECSANNLGLEPAQIAYVTRLGVDLSTYADKEIECSRLIHELTEKITLLTKTIEKTKACILMYPMGLEIAARRLQQITRGAKTWGDVLPDAVLTTPHYFTKGYTKFLDSNPKSTDPTKDDLIILKTLTNLEATKQLPHHRQPTIDFTNLQESKREK